MRLFGGQGSGSLRADLSGSVPHYNVRYSLSRFRIEEFLKALSPKKAAEGSMDFTASLSMRGKTANEMKQTADGEVSLRGENLTLDGVDLDRKVSRFEASQSFNLVDVGAFFIAGPFAPLVTKGYDFAGLFKGSGGSSRIRTLVSDWKVERGIARAKDVAMATNENRIALTGSLDFVNERFDDVTVAVVDGGDAPRCARRSAALSGNRRWRRRASSRPSRGRCSSCSSRRKNSSGGGVKCSTPARWRRRNEERTTAGQHMKCSTSQEMPDGSLPVSDDMARSDGYPGPMVRDEALRFHPCRRRSHRGGGTFRRSPPT